MGLWICIHQRKFKNVIKEKKELNQWCMEMRYRRPLWRFGKMFYLCFVLQNNGPHKWNAFSSFVINSPNSRTVRPLLTPRQCPVVWVWPTSSPSAKLICRGSNSFLIASQLAFCVAAILDRRVMCVRPSLSVLTHELNWFVARRKRAMKPS